MARFFKYFTHHSSAALWLSMLMLAFWSASCTSCNSPTSIEEDSVSKRSREDVPTNPERIVSLAPNITEIVFALDAGELVAGVTRYCDFPPEAAELPKIGGMLDPDFETVVATHPDLVLGVVAGTTHQLPQKLDQAEIAYAFLSVNTLEETYDSILEVGQLIGRSQRAEDLVAAMKSRIDQLAKTVGEKHDTRPRVLFLYEHKPIVAAGPGSFAHQLIELAGAQNVLTEPNAYPVLDMEMLYALNPDVIIDAAMTGAEQAPDANWSPYKSLQAYQNKRMTRFQDPVLLRPGPRLPDALELVISAIYPSMDN